eukprot:Ihof_evm13s169 gene=Ihof_evmTU13s169
MSVKNDISKVVIVINSSGLRELIFETEPAFKFSGLQYASESALVKLYKCRLLQKVVL